MGSAKPKQFVRPPPKKKPAKIAQLDSVDDFQEAADFEESAGGKHRVGDPVKSGRAFVRALDVYDKGLEKHSKSFDLAYNKARLQLEISQQPSLVEHIGVPIDDWLQLTLQSHRYALTLNTDNHDILFNTAQVLTSLAEQLSEETRDDEAVALLHEALELLSSCLSRQEIAYEQHRLDFPDVEEGGVALDPEDVPSAAPDVDMGEDPGESATVESPVGVSDLLDTVHASLSALTTLLPMIDQAALQNLGEMARGLTEEKAPQYLNVLPEEEQDRARLAMMVARATFVAAYANKQFELQMIELQTYTERLGTFDIAGKETDATALCSEAEARVDLVQSTLDRYDDSRDLPATLCWKHLTIAQDLYSQATKLSSEDAQARKAEIYKLKGDLELLRHRIANIPKTDISDGIRQSAATLMQNAQTYYKGAVSHAKITGNDELEEDAQSRLDLAKAIASSMYGGEATAAAPDALMASLEECVEEGLISQHLAQAFTQGSAATSSN